MQLEVPEEQLRILDQLVSDRVANLHTEIRHTDNRDYRHALVEQREHLRNLSSQLRDVSTSTA